MIKKYLAKIIAKDNQGLQLISAYCSEAEVKISEIKHLPKNKIFLILLERFSRDSGKKNLKIHSICKFEFVDSVKSKNINQNDEVSVLKLLAINLLKNKENYSINLFFSDNAYITLSTEIVEVTLEDQNQDI